jgi:NACHT domain
MAEAIAAFGLAANIVQFVDFGSRVTTKFWKFYKSASDSLSDKLDLRTMNSDLQQILADLQESLALCNDVDTSLIQLARECSKVAVELHNVLKCLHSLHESFAKEEMRFRNVIKTLKAAFKDVWRENEIESLQCRLDRFRSQLTLHLLSSLRWAERYLELHNYLLTACRSQTQKTVDQQNVMISQMKAILDDTKQLSGQIDTLGTPSGAFGSFLVDFITAKTTPSDREVRRSQWKRDLITAIYNEDSSEDPQQPQPSIPHSREVKLHMEFIRRLCYSGMDDRERTITHAFSGTFRWIFEDAMPNQCRWANFKDWLESDHKLYWITGKAGSGKSTLMKYICGYQDNRTVIYDGQENINSLRCTRFLRTWAKDCQLIMPTFFFWNSGQPLQMKQTGLFQSLLVQILTHAPQLIPTVSPKRWESLCLFNENKQTRLGEELQDMLRVAVSALPSEIKVCFFVDGLDEFDGNHNILINLLKDLIASPQVKLCVSSRPWVVFEDSFMHAPSLMLQDLTRDDIKLYATSHFHHNAGFTLLRQREPNYADNLVENVASKSAGVFLWLNLVVASLLSGMNHGDRISDLQRRLDKLPPDLEDLYQKILQSIDPFYLGHAAQLFKMVHESSAPSLLLLAAADEEASWLSAIKRPIQLMTTQETEVLEETMRRRINSRSKGFLEAVPASTSMSGQVNGQLSGEMWNSRQVQYLHRTVKDYLESTEVQEKFFSATKSLGDTHLSLCAGHLVLLKTKCSRKSIPENMQFWNCVNQLLYHASQVSLSSSTQLIALMEELNKTSLTIAEMIGSQMELLPAHTDAERKYSLLDAGQWAFSHPAMARKQMIGTHFLSLMIYSGIVPYVESNIKPGCLIQNFSNGSGDTSHCTAKIHPLLLDALNRYRPWSQQPQEPVLEIIACLLQRGADPNFVAATPRGIMSVWKFLLLDITRLCYSQSDCSMIRWLEIVEMFLVYGAGQYKEDQRRSLANEVQFVIGKYNHRLMMGSHPELRRTPFKSSLSEAVYYRNRTPEESFDLLIITLAKGS